MLNPCVFLSSSRFVTNNTALPSLTHLLRRQHTTVAHLSIPQRRHGVLDTRLVEWELHKDGLDAVQGGKVEHVAVDSAGSDNRTLDRDARDDQWHVGELKVASCDGHGEDDACGRQVGEKEGPVCRVVSNPFEYIYIYDYFLFQREETYQAKH